MTGFVGLQTFFSLLTLCRHFQNLNLVHSDILLGSVLFWGLFMCVWYSLTNSSGPLARENWLF